MEKFRMNSRPDSEVSEVDNTKKTDIFWMHKNIVVLSLSFMLLFMAYRSMSALQSSLNAVDGLGNYTNATVYASLIFSSIFLSTFILRLLTAKWTLCVAMLCYGLSIGAQFYPEFYTLLPGGAIVGLIGSAMWSAKCLYVSLIAKQHAATSGESVDVIMVRFFGIFFAIFQSSAIWGNLISSFVLSSGEIGDLSQKDVYGLCGANFCPHNNDNDHNNDTSSTDNMTKIYTLAGTYVACALLAVVVAALWLDPLSKYGEPQEKATIECSKFLETLVHLKKPEQLALLPITVWSGLEQGYLGSDFTAGYITCAYGMEKVGFVLICYGVCNALTCLSLGPINKRTGRIPITVTGAMINTGVIIAMHLWKPDSGSAVIFYILAALWGVADAIWQTQVNAMYGLAFDTKDQPAAYGNYRIWESLGFFAAYLFSNHLCIRIKLWILTGALLTGMIGYFCIELKLKIKNSNAVNQKVANKF